MGGITEPKCSLGSCPAWIANVLKFIEPRKNGNTLSPGWTLRSVIRRSFERLDGIQQFSIKNDARFFRIGTRRTTVNCKSAAIPITPIHIAAACCFSH